MESTRDFFVWLWKYLKNYKIGLTVAGGGIFLFSLSNTGVLIYGFYEFAQQWEAGTLGRSFSVSVPEVPFLFPSGAEWVMATGTPREMIHQLIPYVVILVLIRVFSDFVRLFVMRYVSIGVARDIRSDLYENMIYRPVTFFEQRNVGDLISRLSNDIQQVQNMVGRGLRNLFQAPLELLMAVGIVTYVAPWLSVFFLVLPLCGYAIYRAGNRIKRYSRVTQDVMGGLVSLMQERFSGIKLVKSAGNEDRELKDFNRKNQKHFRKLRRKIVVDSALRPMMHFTILAVGLGVAYIAFRLILAGYLSVAALGTFVFAIPWIYKPLRKLSGLNNSIQTSRGAAERIEQVFRVTLPEHSNLTIGTREPTFEQNVVFDDVDYSYPNQNELALKNVSLKLSRGENLALVGPSGAGKSTLTDLLLRFYDPTDGQVRLDGHDLEKYRLKSYRRLFGLVTQSPILFDDTVTQNIRYGRETISEVDVREAARRAEALSFIERLPRGFDTPLGEKGVKLSGGERQRIVLARALANDPKILVLDEATSDVDSQSEQKILRAIKNLPDSISLVTISHDLTTVQFADRIVVLNNREIEAVGSSDDLIETSSTYRQLYRHQADELKTVPG